MVAFPAYTLDQAMAIENGMDGAFGGNSHIAGQAANQQLADFARSPMRFVALELNDQALDLMRQLIGVADRAPGAVGQGLEPVVFIALEDLVAGLPRDAEFSAHEAHLLA